MHPRRSLLALIPAAGAAAWLLLSPATVRADTTHVVSPGNTLGSIARRYKVPVAALREANGLGRTTPIRLGQKLVVPDADSAAAFGPPVRTGARARGEIEGGLGRPRSAGAAGRPVEAPARPPNRPGVVAFVSGSDRVEVRVRDRRGAMVPASLAKIARALRFQHGAAPAEHAIDPRLAALVTIVSDHFGGRDLHVVSGYRPFSPSQYTPHSNHNVGRAIDFAVRGVPNATLRDFCRTLRKVGVGYYPNSTFVHLDVRETSAYWIDYARPGEPPRYGKGPGLAPPEESVGDVLSSPPPGADPAPDGSANTQAAPPATSDGTSGNGPTSPSSPAGDAKTGP